MAVKSLDEVQGFFSPEEYPPDQNTGRSNVPPADIHALLNSAFDSYSYEPTVGGITPDGKAYVGIKLTVRFADKEYAVSGMADGNINIAGVLTMALANAVLRGLQAGSELPQYQPGFEPPSQPQQPQAPYQQSPVTYPNPGHAVSGPQGYQPRNQPNNGQSGRNFGPWTGEVMCKSKGMQWKNLHPQDLMSWAEQGNNLAKMELERRGMSPGASQAQSNWPKNEFSGTGYTN